MPCRNIKYCYYLVCTQICSRILDRKDKDGRYEKLFVKKESASADSAGQLFVDTAVYSRNRCFRLALSSKAGKSSVLLPTGRYKAQDMVCSLLTKNIFIKPVILLYLSYFDCLFLSYFIF